jgi:hypothetical protein
MNEVGSWRSPSRSFDKAAMRAARPGSCSDAAGVRGQRFRLTLETYPRAYQVRVKQEPNRSGAAKLRPVHEEDR